MASRRSSEDNFSDGGPYSAPSGANRRRLNPSRRVIEQSYAYGAGPDADAIRQAAINREADSSLEALRRDGPSSAPMPSGPSETGESAKDRYGRLREKLLQTEAAQAASSQAAAAQAQEQAESTSAARSTRRSASRVAREAESAAQGRRDAARPGKTISSFFVRQSIPEDDGDGIDELQPEHESVPSTSNNLLRGAQQPGHDAFSHVTSPGRANGSMSLRSNSDMGESVYDYTAEERFARDREVEQTRAKGKAAARSPREADPPRAASFASDVSNWAALKRSRGKSASQAGSDQAEAASSARTKSRSKGRNSKDNAAYRPTQDDVEEESEDSEGKKHGHSRQRGAGASSGSSDALRAGQDAAKLWGSKAPQSYGFQGKGGDNNESPYDDSGSTQEDIDDARARRDRSSAERVLASVARGARSASESLAGPAQTASDALVGSVDARRRTAGLLAFAAVAFVAYTIGSFATSAGLPSLPGFLRPSAKLWSGSRQERTFNVPSLPPDTLDDWTSRISAVEDELANLGRRATTSERAIELVTKQEKELRQFVNERIADLDKDARSTRKRLSDIESNTKRENEKMKARLEQLEKTSSTGRSELESLRAKLAQVSSGGSKGRADPSLSSSEVEVINKRIASLEQHVEDTDKKIVHLVTQVEGINKIAAAANDGLKSLEKKLPAKLPAQLDPKTLKFHIDPAFFDELKKMLTNAEVVGRPGSQQIKPTKEAWTDFYAANEQALRDISQEEVKHALASRMQTTGVALDRNTFMELLHTKLDEAKKKLEAQFNDQVGDMQQEVLAKVRQQQEMYERSGSWTARRPAANVQRTHHWANDLPDLPLITKDGTDARGAMLAMIDAALESYSADRLGRNDFARYTAGARPIVSLTSESYGSGKSKGLSWASWAIRPITGSSKLPARSPALALHHDNAPGNCWPFAGDNGTLGVQLARKAIIEEISIDHIPRAIAFESASSAPKDVTVWGKVEAAGDVARLWEYRHNNMAAEPAPSPPQDDFMLLGSFTYDISEGARAVQTFPASEEAKALRIPVQITQVHISSNHGHKHYTCLYRVRMHGQEWNGDDSEENDYM